jgi:hypothetical protein
MHSFSEIAESMVQSMVTDLQYKFDAFNSSISARLDQLGTVCYTLLDARSGPEPNRKDGQPVTVDRESNIVLFGVPGNRDAFINHGVTASTTFRTLKLDIRLTL